MNEETTIFDLIEKYHLGLLSDEEKTSVEKRAQIDAAFAEYLKISGLSNELVYVSGLDMLRERMTNDLAALDKKEARRKWKIGAGITVALLLLALLIYWTRYAAKKNSTQPDIQNKKSSDTILNEKVNTGSAEISEGNQRKTILQQKEGTKQTTKDYNPNTSVSSLIMKTDSATGVESFVKEEDEFLNPADTKSNASSKCDLSFHAIVQASCKGEMSGAIILDEQSLSGGVMPYRFHISNSTKESSTGVFSELSNGHYTVTMYDSKSCSYSKEIIVPEKSCTSRKSESFNPDYGETWKIPAAEGEAGDFTIYNRAGITVFKGSFTAHNSAEWQGVNAQGMPVDAGLYVCVIEYSGGKTETIDISIIR